MGGVTRHAIDDAQARFSGVIGELHGAPNLIFKIRKNFGFVKSALKKTSSQCDVSWFAHSLYAT
jgi:hypothetical protein